MYEFQIVLRITFLLAIESDKYLYLMSSVWFNAKF